MKHHFDNIRQWAKDRNIIEGATTHAQFVKLVEEIGEMAVAHSREEIKDGIGDAYVVCTILAEQMGFAVESVAPAEMSEEEAYMPDAPYLIISLGKLAHAIAKQRVHEAQSAMHAVLKEMHCVAAMCHVAIEDCLEAAWNEIKDRKGRMINGVFIKESDLENHQG